MLLLLALVVLVTFAFYQEWAGRERSPMTADEFAEALAEAEVRSPALVLAVHQIRSAYETEQAQSYLANDLLGMVPTELNRHGLVDAVDDIGELWGSDEVTRCSAVLADPASDLHLHLALTVLLAEGATSLALDDLVKLALHHDGSFMRRMATGVSAKLGPRAGRSYANALSDADGAVRVAAATALGAVDCPPSVAAELQAALQDDSPEVSVRCAAKLVSMGDGAPATVAALVTGISSHSEALRSLSLKSLGSLPASAASEVVGPLLEACARDDAEVRWQAGQALARLGEGALPALMEASASQEPRVRFWAARALGYVPNPSDPVIAALVERLDDGDRTVHTEAAAGMGAVILAGGSMEGIQAETMGISGIALTSLLAHDRLPGEIDGLLVSLMQEAEPLRQMLGIKAAVALGREGDMVMDELAGLADQQDSSVGRLARAALAQLL